MRYWINSGICVLAIFLLSICNLSAQVDKYNCNTYIPPGNDICRDAIEFTDNIEGVTCCGEIEGIDLCGDMETGVWFSYVQDLDASILTIENLDIEGPIAIEIYSGDCDNLSLVGQSDCSGFTQTSLQVPNCTGIIYIHIATKDKGCGAFSMTATDVSGCGAAENCDDITPANTMNPVSDAGPVSITSCLDFSCNSTCENQSVWFQVQTDFVATGMQLEIKNADFDPIISVFSINNNNCAAGSDILVCNPIADAEIVSFDVAQDFTYVIEVSSADGNTSAFDICVSTIQDNVDCAEASLTVIRPEYPTANPNGPYCPGETVTFCYDLEFFVNARGEGNNCQWPQGIVPILGGGWDQTTNNVASSTPPGWAYWPDGSVDYNVTHPSVGLTTDANGNRILEYGAGGLSPGDLLPEGWWFVTNGTDVGCVNDGDPDNGWGMVTPCDDVAFLSHCFTLTTRSVSDIQECEDAYSRDLSLAIFVFADGETGCYSFSACTGDTPATFSGELDCSTLYDLEAEDGEICSGEFVSIPVSVVGGYDVPIFVEAVSTAGTSGAQDRVFQGGSGIVPDQITNNTSSDQIITYAVSLYNPESDCPAPTIFFDVVVHPEINVVAPGATICEGELETLFATPGLDTYDWYNLNNDLLSQTNELEVSDGGIYILQVTEGDCSRQIEVEVQSVEPIVNPFTQSSIEVCNQDGGNFPTSIDLNSLVLPGVTGIWLDESSFPIPDPSNISFEGTTQGPVTYLFFTTNAPAPCENVEIPLTINVQNCGCPDVVIDPIPDLCIDGSTLDLDNYLTTVDPGVWQILGGPDVTSISIQGSEIVLRDLIVPGTYTFGYKVDAVGYGPNCIFEFRVDVKISKTPAAEIVTAATACNADTGAEPSVLDLDDMFISGDAGEWTSSDFAINADGTVDFTDVQPGDYTITYATNVAEDPCLDPSYDLTVTVIDCKCEPLDFIPVNNFCQGFEIVDLKALVVEAGLGVWTISSIDATTLPLIQNNSEMLLTSDSEVATYTLTYTLTNQDLPIACPRSIDISFEIVGSPEVELIPQAAVCNTDVGTDPDYIDLDDLYVSGSTGSWTTAEGLIIDADNVVQFAGEDVRDYTFTYTTDSAISPCENVSVDVLVTVRDCSCPSIVLGTQDNLCQGANSFLLSNLIVNADAGIWTLESNTATTPPVINGDLVEISDLTDIGLYTLKYTLSDTGIPPSCQTEDLVSFEVIAPPSAVIQSVARACNTDTGSDPDFIDLDDMFVSGSTGIWTNNEGIIIGTDNVASFNGSDIRDYTFTYTTNDALAPCNNISYDLIVSVADCACPPVIISQPQDYCASTDTIFLNELIIDAGPGNWDIQSTASTSPVLLGDMVMIDDNTEAGVISLSYTLSDPTISPACNKVSSVQFEIFEGPSAVVTPALAVCNSDNSVDAFMIDLDTLVISGASGAWTFDNTILSADADNVINFEGVALGDYTLVYTTDQAVFPCSDPSYEVSISVYDCACPFIGLLDGPILCQSTDLYDLNQLVLPGVGAGDWTFNNGPETVVLTGTEITTNDLDPGFYTFDYTLQDLVTGCPSVEQTFVQVVERPELSLVPEVEVCNEDNVTAPRCIDLNVFADSADGIWEAPTDYQGDFSNLASVCFDSAASGTELIFKFTTNYAQAPCDNVSAQLIVKVLDCSCPNLSLNNPVPLCNQGDVLDLTSLETPETVDGSWIFVNGPDNLVINPNNTVNVDGVAIGIYSFEFIPTVTPGPNCLLSNSVEVQVFSPLSAGTGNIIDFCAGEINSLDLFSLLDNADLGGTWNEISSTPTMGGFDELSGVLTIDNESAGIYEFAYSHLSSATCPSSEAKVTIVLHSAPTADAGGDFELTCAENTYTLGGTNMASGPRIEYTWTEVSGQSIANSTTQNPIVTQPGTYMVHVTDNVFGCESFDEVVVSEDRSIPTFDTEVIPASCDGTTLGGIVISNSQGGNGDYQYSIDGGVTWADETLFSNLDPGTYTVIIQDGNGCESSIEGIEVPEPIYIGLDIGEDREVQFGNHSVTINLTTIASPEDIDIVVWEEDGDVLCEGGHNDCFEIEVDPDEVSTYCVTVTDNNGCQETACIVVTEVVDPNLYIPNIFSPDIDGFNNRFFVQSDEFIVEVKEFFIMNRWGERVFESIPNHAPNDPSYGWDGMYKGKMSPSAIYTYFILATDVTGEEIKTAGDILLVR